MKIKKNSFLKMGILSVAMMYSLLIGENIAKADEFSLLEAVDLKDSNGDVVKKLQRGEVVEGVMNGDRILVDYNYGIYEIDKGKGLIIKQKVNSSLSLEKNTLLFVTPSIFSTTLDELNTVEKPIDANGFEIVELKDGEKVNGWLQIKLADGLIGWIIESSVIEDKSKNKAVEHKRYVLKTLNKDGIVIPRAAEVSINSVTKDGFIITYKEKKIEVKPDEIGTEKPAPLGQARGTAKHLLDFAKTKLGIAYVWAGDGISDGGYDCSGFTRAVFASVGINIPRTAASQSVLGSHVDWNDLQPGDLMYFETYKEGVSHVGIYMGDGKMIHAGGDRVQIQSIYTNYYKERYLFSKRIL